MSEQNVEYIDDVHPDFLPRLALVDRAGNLGYLRGRPAVTSVLVANRQMEGIAHDSNGRQPAGSLLEPTPRLEPRTPSLRTPF